MQTNSGRARGTHWHRLEGAALFQRRDSGDWDFMAEVSQSSAGDSWANEREFLSRPSCSRRNRFRSQDGRGCVPFVEVTSGSATKSSCLFLGPRLETPGLTDLSTNATCQLQRTENSAVRAAEKRRSRISPARRTSAREDPPKPQHMLNVEDRIAVSQRRDAVNKNRSAVAT